MSRRYVRHDAPLPATDPGSGSGSPRDTARVAICTLLIAALVCDGLWLLFVLASGTPAALEIIQHCATAGVFAVLAIGLAFAAYVGTRVGE